LALKVFDYRKDLRNIVITPEIRSRFLKFEPGTGGARHSHDLGHEVFLVLEGQAEFEIEGERAILGPGEMCIAYADEMHEVTCVGDKPITMYLSVTPHLEPTHTSWTEAGTKKPFRYGPSTKQERADAGLPPFDPVALIDEHLAACNALAETATASAQDQETQAVALRHALASGDKEAAKEAVDAMWASIYATCKALRSMEMVWNQLSPAATE
jgi:quercetin dioxygenase-like cupin family protein